MSKEVENLRARMASIREDLGEDVEAVVEQARELTDWRNVVKKHPVLSITAAAAVGFLLVPKRLNVMSPSSHELEQLAKSNRLVVKPRAEVRRQAGLVSPIVNVVAGAVLRSALAIAGQHVGRLLTPDSTSHRGDQATTTTTQENYP